MAPPLKPLRELSYVPMADVAADGTFRLRHPGDVSSLARSIAQVGQLFPVDVRETETGLQPLAGFRRLEALRLLQRNRVLVRNHGPLSDAAAATVAAADAIDNRALALEDLRELHDRYVAMGWGTPSLLELIGRSIEKEGERLEDLAAKLKGEAPPDRSVPDEDGDDEVADGRDADASAPEAFGNPAAGSAPEAIGNSATGLAPEAFGYPATGSAPSSPGTAASNSEAPAPAALGNPSIDAPSSNPESVAPGSDAPAAAVLENPSIDAPSSGVIAPGNGPNAADGAAASGIAAGEHVLVRTLAVTALEPLPLEPPAASRLGTEAAPGGSDVTPDLLARQLAARLSEATQDLAALAEHWSLVPAGLRSILVDQLDYYGRLGSWLVPNDGDDT